jgi:mannan endo-1,4-beta-mannosidase
MAMLHGVFTSDDVKIGNFEAWSGKKTAVITKFADLFALDAEQFVADQLAPIWEYDHVPLLTLEPWGESDVERELADGKHDAVLDEWATAIQRYVTSHDPEAKLFIRFAHEMNGDWYPWSENPGAYKDMWRYVRRTVVTKDGVDRSNCRWIWCVNSDDTTNERAEDYYPGDDRVDWVAIDGYNFGSKRDWSSWRLPDTTFDAMLNRVRSVSGDKPVAIPETGSTAQKHNQQNRPAKQAWIHALYDWADSRDVAMLNWFNVNKTTKWAEGKSTMDWSVFGYGQQYEAYSDEIVKSRVVGPSGPRRLTADQFAGRL